MITSLKRSHCGELYMYIKGLNHPQISNCYFHFGDMLLIISRDDGQPVMQLKAARCLVGVSQTQTDAR